MGTLRTPYSMLMDELMPPLRETFVVSSILACMAAMIEVLTVAKKDVRMKILGQTVFEEMKRQGIWNNMW